MRLLLATLGALLVLCAPASAAVEGFTTIRCDPAGFAQRDPLLNWSTNPANPSHHDHEFFGNRNAMVANATVASLKTATSSCEVPSDINALWQPAGRNAAGVLTPALEVEYRLINDADPDQDPVVKPPDGLSQVHGNTAGRTTQQTTGEKLWRCRGGATVTAHYQLPATCPTGSTYVELVTYQGTGCWDSSKGPGGGLGRSTGPADNRAQWVNTDFNCEPPLTKVPRVSMITRWPASIAGGWLDSDDKDRDGDPDVIPGTTYHVDIVYVDGRDATGRSFYDRTLALCFNWTAPMTNPCTVPYKPPNSPIDQTANFRQGYTPFETVLAGRS